MTKCTVSPVCTVCLVVTAESNQYLHKSEWTFVPDIMCFLGHHRSVHRALNGWIISLTLSPGCCMKQGFLSSRWNLIITSSIICLHAEFPSVPGSAPESSSQRGAHPSFTAGRCYTSAELCWLWGAALRLASPVQRSASLFASCSTFFCRTESFPGAAVLSSPDGWTYL